MNLYYEVKRRHQKEVDNFPLGFAFSNKQFESELKRLNVEPKDLVSIGGGGFVRRSDFQSLIDMMDRHIAEIEENVKQSDQFIFDMFTYELRNHEFSYTRDVEPTLECLDLTWDDIDKDVRLKEGLEKAIRIVLREGD